MIEIINFSQHCQRHSKPPSPIALTLDLQCSMTLSFVTVAPGVMMTMATGRSSHFGWGYERESVPGRAGSRPIGRMRSVARDHEA